MASSTRQNTLALATLMPTHRDIAWPPSYSLATSHLTLSREFELGMFQLSDENSILEIASQTTRRGEWADEKTRSKPCRPVDAALRRSFGAAGLARRLAASTDPPWRGQEVRGPQILWPIRTGQECRIETHKSSKSRKKRLLWLRDKVSSSSSRGSERYIAFLSTVFVGARSFTSTHGPD